MQLVVAKHLAAEDFLKSMRDTMHYVSYQEGRGSLDKLEPGYIN